MATSRLPVPRVTPKVPLTPADTDSFTAWVRLPPRHRADRGSPGARPLPEGA
jgi:hypothetical protein